MEDESSSPLDESSLNSSSPDRNTTVAHNSGSSMDRRGGQNADDESLDTLYKAMEMAEPLPSQPLQKSSEPPDFIAVDANKMKAPTNRGETTPTPSPTQVMMQEEEERAFIWVLLEFARKRCWKKKLLTVVIIASSVYVITDIIFLGNIVPFVNGFLEWMTMHTVLAVIACIFFFAAATLVFVPHAILTCGAGWAFSNVLGFGFGLIIGLFVSFMGSALGAVLSFIRSRYMMRDLVELFAERFPIVKAVDRALERKGFKIMLLLRLCPIIPFNGLNYIGGVTSVSLEEYTQALIGILPITLLWSTVGASADRITNRSADELGEQVLMVSLLFFGVLCGMAGLAKIYRYARDELKKEIEYDRAESWRKYKRNSSSNLDDADSTKRPRRTEPSNVDEGIEVLNRADMTLLAVLGIDHFDIETQHPPDQNEDDDDPFWYWA